MKTLSTLILSISLLPGPAVAAICSSSLSDDASPSVSVIVQNTENGERILVGRLTETSDGAMSVEALPTGPRFEGSPLLDQASIKAVFTGQRLKQIKFSPLLKQKLGRAYDYRHEIGQASLGQHVLVQVLDGFKAEGNQKIALSRWLVGKLEVVTAKGFRVTTHDGIRQVVLFSDPIRNMWILEP